MRTSELKTNLIQLINQINDNSKLQALYNLLSHNSKVDDKDWWEQLSTNEKASIQSGIEDFKKGNVQSSDQVRNSLSRKYPHLRFK